MPTMVGVPLQDPEAASVESLADALGARVLAAFPPRETPQLRGPRLVTAILPSGKTIRLRVPVPFAPQAEVNRLVRAVREQQARSALESRANARALRRSGDVLTQRVRRTTEARLRLEKRLRKRMAEGDERLAKRVHEVVAQRRKGDSDFAAIDRIARRQRTRALLDGAVIATGLPLFAAYGQRGSPFAAHNLTLALSLGVWLFGDEVADLLSGWGTRDDGRFREADVWSYLAPFGNALTGWWLLHEHQHCRFLTGHAGPDDFRVFGWPANTPAPSVTVPARPPPSPAPPSPAGALTAAPPPWRPIRLAARDPVRPSFYPRVAPPTALVNDTSRRTEAYVATIPVVNLVAPEHVAAFESFERPAAVATVRRYEPDSSVAPADAVELHGLHAEVRAGILTLTVLVSCPAQAVPTTTDELLSHLEVAWMVDTRDPKKRP